MTNGTHLGRIPFIWPWSAANRFMDYMGRSKNSQSRVLDRGGTEMSLIYFFIGKSCENHCVSESIYMETPEGRDTRFAGIKQDVFMSE